MMHSKTYTLEEATRKMESYCAYQERCYKEVRQKLIEMKMIPDAIDHIICYLVDHKFLDEQRYAMSFVRGKFNYKQWGKQRIEKELKFREVSNYNIKKALKQISDQEYLQVLDKLVEKAYRNTKGSNIYQHKQKMINYLLYRGWEPHLIYDLVNDYMEAN